MSKAYGTMVSEARALELLEVEVADAVMQSGVDPELYECALNRIRYRFDQTVPVKPKRHKGKYISDYYTCGNCGSGVTINDNYCWNCGFAIGWDSIRCLTGKDDANG